MTQYTKTLKSSDLSEIILSEPIANIDNADRINDALILGNVFLSEGVWEIGSPILIPNNRTLRGVNKKLTFIQPHSSWNPSSSLSDDPINAMIKVQGSITTADTMTLSAIARAHATTVSVNSDTNFVANGYVFISGTNAGGDMFGQTDGTNVIKSELVQIVSKASNILTLYSATRVHHSSTTSIKRANPILKPTCVDFTVRAPGGNFSTGILFDYCINPIVKNVGIEGFSHSGICFRWCEDPYCDIFDYGETNSAVFLLASHGGRVKMDSALNGLRSHANSLSKRGKITARWRCDDLLIYDSVIRRGHCGIKLNGGTKNTIKNCLIEDMSCHERALTGEGLNIVLSGNSLAGGIEINSYIVSDDGEYGHNLTVDNICLRDIKSYWSFITFPIAGDTEFAFHIEDNYGAKLSNISIINDGGANPMASSSNWKLGIKFFDCFEIYINNLNIRGCDVPVYVYNSAFVASGSMYLSATHAQGSASYGMVFFGTTNLSLDYLTLQGFLYPWQIDAAVNLRINNLILSSLQFSDVVYAINKTGEILTAGAICELGNNSGTLSLVDHTSITKGKKAISVHHSVAVDGHDFAALVGGGIQTVTCSGSVSPGDYLEMHATAHAVVTNNSSTNPVGVALTGGTNTLIRMGPP